MSQQQKNVGIHASGIPAEKKLCNQIIVIKRKNTKSGRESAAPRTAWRFG